MSITDENYMKIFYDNGLPESRWEEHHGIRFRIKFKSLDEFNEHLEVFKQFYEMEMNSAILR